MSVKRYEPTAKFSPAGAVRWQTAHQNEVGEVACLPEMARWSSLVGVVWVLEPEVRLHAGVFPADGLSRAIS